MPPHHLQLSHSWIFCAWSPSDLSICSQFQELKRRTIMMQTRNFTEWYWQILWCWKFKVGCLDFQRIYGTKTVMTWCREIKIFVIKPLASGTTFFTSVNIFSQIGTVTSMLCTSSFCGLYKHSNLKHSLQRISRILSECTRCGACTVFLALGIFFLTLWQAKSCTHSKKWCKRCPDIIKMLCLECEYICIFMWWML